VDTQGIIRFAHWDADYKKRLEHEDLLKAPGEIRPASQPSREREEQNQVYKWPRVRLQRGQRFESTSAYSDCWG